MESAEHARVAGRSIGEWSFQLATITIGVLIALSFDARLGWTGDRTLVDEARTTIALELAANRADLEGYLLVAAERTEKIDIALELLAELDAGAEPTVRSLDFTLGLPSLNSAGWQSAERTGALALMDYRDVQELAEILTLQSLFTNNLKPVLLAVNHIGAMMHAPSNPFETPVVRDGMREQLLELCARLELGDQFGRQLLDGYTRYQARSAVSRAAK